MADRIVVLDQGRIQQVGAPLELYDKPANKFVASFIGSPSMSFVTGALEKSGNSPRFRTPDGEVLPVMASVSTGGTVEAGIRPEHFIAGSGGDLTIRVDVVEPTGSETHVYGMIGTDTVRAVFRDRLGVKPGDKLPVTVNPKNVHLFDKATGLPV